MTVISDHPLPLWRWSATGETAKDAAQRNPRRTLRQRTLDLIEAAPTPVIPETILARLRAEGVQTFLTSVRPRCSELARMGLIADSGTRQKGEGGCNAIAWRATTPDERSRFAALKALEAEKMGGDDE